MAFSGRRRFSQYWASNPSNSGAGYSSPEMQRANTVNKEFKLASGYAKGEQDKPKARPKSAPKARKFEGVTPRSITASPQMGYSGEIPAAPQSARPASKVYESDMQNFHKKVYHAKGNFDSLYGYDISDADAQELQEYEEARKKGTPSGSLSAREPGSPKSLGVEQEIFDEWQAVSTKRKTLHESKMRLRQAQEKLQMDEERLIVGRKQLQEEAELVEREREQLRQERARLQKDAPSQREELDRLRSERRATAAMVEAISQERRNLCHDRMRIEEELARLQRELEEAGHVIVQDKLAFGSAQSK